MILLKLQLQMAHLLLFVKRLPAKFNENIQYIVVENSAVAAGIMAHNFYGQLIRKNKACWCNRH